MILYLFSFAIKDQLWSMHSWPPKILFQLKICIISITIILTINHGFWQVNLKYFFFRMLKHKNQNGKVIWKFKFFFFFFFFFHAVLGFPLRPDDLNDLHNFFSATSADRKKKKFFTLNYLVKFDVQMIFLFWVDWLQVFQEMFPWKREHDTFCFSEYQSVLAFWL